MVTTEQMMQALMELMPDPSRLQGMAPDDPAIDAKVKGILGEAGLDVDGVFLIGNSIVQMAVAAEEPPEVTVVGAFATGAAMVAILHKKGALT